VAAVNREHGAKILTETYQEAGLHDSWEAVYRNNRQGRLDDLTLDRIFEKLSPPPGSLFLDAGCGVGDHSLRLVRRGYRCVGVDISETILERARARAAAYDTESIVFQRASLEQLPFPDGHFDYVHCRGVLMHIPDWQSALNEICRVIRAGGGIIVMENNDVSLEHHCLMLARRIFKPRSVHRPTASGSEFWSTTSAGNPFVVRTARVASIVEALRVAGFTVQKPMTDSLVDIGRLPSAMRDLAIKVNRLCLTLSIPWAWCSGVTVLAVKG
jgi:ubiquinone/menaquinone biosynthesis C-methylase UbiE